MNRGILLTIVAALFPLLNGCSTEYVQKNSFKDSNEGDVIIIVLPEPPPPYPEPAPDPPLIYYPYDPNPPAKELPPKKIRKPQPVKDRNPSSDVRQERKDRDRSSGNKNLRNSGSGRNINKRR